MNVTTIFEIKQNEINLLIGYYVSYKKQVVLYSESKGYNGVSQNGIISQTNVMAEEIGSMIKNANAKGININKNNVFVVIDPYNMTTAVRSSRTSSTSTDEDKPKITAKDIENLFMMAQREDTSNQNFDVVDVFRISYFDENRKAYSEPPIDIVSKNLEMKYSLYFLPILVQSKIVTTFKVLDIKIKKITINLCALTQCIKKDSSIKEKAFSIVQSDLNDTVLGVSDSNGLVGAKSIQLGVGNLVNRIVNAFSISYETANEILESYGLDKREYTYRAAIGEYIFEGKKKPILQSDINAIIIPFCKEFAAKLYEAKKSIMSSLGFSDNDGLIKSYIMTGKLFEIFGIKEYFSQISPDIIFYSKTNPAIDGTEFTNALAVLSIQPQYDEMFITDKKVNNEPKFTLNRGE